MTFQEVIQKRLNGETVTSEEYMNSHFGNSMTTEEAIKKIESGGDVSDLNNKDWFDLLMVRPDLADKYDFEEFCYDSTFCNYDLHQLFKAHPQLAHKCNFERADLRALLIDVPQIAKALFMPPIMLEVTKFKTH